MPHKTFMTTEDKISTAVRPPSGLVAVGWAAATAGLAIAMVAVTSGVAALGLGLATAYSAFKTVDKTVSAFKGAPKPLESHSTKEDLRELDATVARGLANNQEAIPQLTDDIAQQDWQRQVAERARADAVNHANRGR